MFKLHYENSEDLQDAIAFLDPFQFENWPKWANTKVIRMWQIPPRHLKHSYTLDNLKQIFKGA